MKGHFKYPNQLVDFTITFIHTLETSWISSKTQSEAQWQKSIQKDEPGSLKFFNELESKIMPSTWRNAAAII